jgi:hypothetical protein
VDIGLTGLAAQSGEEAVRRAAILASLLPKGCHLDDNPATSSKLPVADSIQAVEIVHAEIASRVLDLSPRDSSGPSSALMIGRAMVSKLGP